MIGDEVRANNTEWPDEDVQTLRELIDQKLTAGDIGRLMGRTRNAIIGKLRRIGVPLAGAKTAPREPRAIVERPAMGHKQAPQEPSERRHRSIRSRKPTHPVEPHIVPVNKGIGITILKLNRNKCHTVVGSTRPEKGLPRYCGRPAWNETAYCEDHYAVFHRPFTRRG